MYTSERKRVGGEKQRERGRVLKVKERGAGERKMGSGRGREKQ